ncbi:right-handed parallel beta-helix repeat-containing protein [Domibacillus indicus]|uniref:right-handed parallel beta-helix repeat-containing protein n=1 Tax=Domibacillus indicus TaxID=1437523 RepID=UPI0006183342|nr:NosD domain-containing protein [Domibacillus indicus]
MGTMMNRDTETRSQYKLWVPFAFLILLIAAGLLLQQKEPPATGQETAQLLQEEQPVPERQNNTKPPEEFDAGIYGAVPNDSKDDTKAIQAAIDAAAEKGGIVRIPAGTFLINTDPQTGSLNVKDGSDIRMDSKTVLQSIPNDLPIYRVFTVYNRKNVKISGGTLIGDRYEHKGTEGEFGHGIFIGGNSSHVTVSGVISKDFWGDGFIIEGDTKSGSYPTNIVVEKSTGHNNRRQGISITAGKNIVVKNNTFSKTNGTSPEAGIDLERDPPFNLPLENVSLLNNKLLDNHGYGIAFVYASGNRAENNIIQNNKEGGVYIGGGQDDGAANNNTVHDNVISGNGTGIFVNFSTSNLITANTIEKNAKDGVSLINHIGENQISQNIIRKNKGNGLYIWGGLYDKSGVVIQSNEVKDNGGIGLSIVDVSDIKVMYNQLLDNKDSGITLKSVQGSTVHKNTSKGNGGSE